MTNIERTKLNWEPPSEAENERRENRPNIKLNQIQSERRREAELFIIFANRGSIRNPRKNNADQRPSDEEERDLIPPPAPVDLSDEELEHLGQKMTARIQKLRSSTIEKLHVKGRAALLRAF